MRQTVSISGASFFAATSVRQSNDWMVTSGSSPDARIASTVSFANVAASTVAPALSGVILVSMLSRAGRLRALTSVEHLGERGEALAVLRPLLGKLLRVAAVGIEPADVVAREFGERQRVDRRSLAPRATVPRDRERGRG